MSNHWQRGGVTKVGVVSEDANIDAGELQFLGLCAAARLVASQDAAACAILSDSADHRLLLSHYSVAMSQCLAPLDRAVREQGRRLADVSQSFVTTLSGLQRIAPTDSWAQAVCRLVIWSRFALEARELLPDHVSAVPGADDALAADTRLAQFADRELRGVLAQDLDSTDQLSLSGRRLSGELIVHLQRIAARHTELTGWLTHQPTAPGADLGMVSETLSELLRRVHEHLASFGLRV